MPARYIYPLSIIIAILVILLLLVAVATNFPTGITLVLIFILFVLSGTSYAILQKNKKAYQQGKITFSASRKNTVLEISAILLTMLLAGLAGRYLSGFLTGNMNSYPIKLITGIGIGILVGWAIGLFIKFASSRFLKTSPGE